MRPAQAGTTPPQTPPPEGMSAAAIAGSKQDPASVQRGSGAFKQYCAGCHGALAKGGPGAPDLVRSLLVLDDENGNLIGPVIREGRPDKGMPRLGLSEPQIADIVSWLHVRTYSAGHRGTYVFQNVITGDAKKGEQYFSSNCSSCHSVTGDLKGIGAKYDALSLQSRWLQPRSTRAPGGARGGGGGAKPASPDTRMLPTVSVTTADGQTITGQLDRIDDFSVSLRDAKNQFHSFAREGATPKVEVKDPLQVHTDSLRHYTDDEIHNMTAYLVTLK